MPMKKPRIVEIHNITYANVPKQKDGWVSVEDFLPILFDLVELETQAGKCAGWFTGHGWDGKRFKQHYVVTRWRRLKF